jgi:DNA ligase (NAD+)
MHDFRTILKHFVDHSASQPITLSVPETQLLIDKANAAYYRTGKPIISDEQYDALMRHLRELAPADERHERIGAQYNPTEISNKVTHSIPMGSLDNTDDGIIGYVPWVDWVKDKLKVNELHIMASLKMDGGSICATYKHGQLVRVATRGNGEVGEDITANAANFMHLPTVLPYPLDADVRGEAILFKADFDTVCQSIPVEERSNPRNVGNGILGRHDGTDSNYIRFMAFNLYVDQTGALTYGTEEQKFAALKELGFTPVPHRLCKTVEEFNIFYSGVVDGRDQLPFEVDGIVVVANDIAQQRHFVTADKKSVLRPKHSRAVKFPHKSNTTILESVEVSVGHTRAIIPTGKLQTVRIGGVNVSSVLLNNYDEVERLDVAIGDTVEVILAGDIIPKVLRVIKRPVNRIPITVPTYCPTCNATTTRECRGKPGAVLYCSNPNCPAAVFGKLDHWIGTSKKGVGILDIGDTMIKALWDNGMLADPADLYTLTVDGIKDVVLDNGKIGNSRATKIVANIAAKKHLSLATFLGALGIDLLGRRRVELLREAAKGLLDNLDDWLDVEKLKTIELPGFGDSIRAAVIAGIEENLQLIRKLQANGVTVGDPIPTTAETETAATDEQKLFTNLSFCFTGTRSNIDDVVRLGGTIKSGVSKGLDFLVQMDALSVSVKTQKAEGYGTQIISLDYLQKAIRGEVKLTKTQPA